MKKPIQVEGLSESGGPKADDTAQLGRPGLGEWIDAAAANSMNQANSSASGRTGPDPKAEAEERRRIALEHAVRIAPPNVFRTEVVLNAKSFERYLKGEE